MEKIFVDTNVVLDLLSKREEFYREAQDLFTLSDHKEINLYVSSLTIANAHYLISKSSLEALAAAVTHKPPNNSNKTLVSVTCKSGTIM